MSSQAVAVQHDELEVIECPVADVHQGRPMHPLYRERGDELMAQWFREDVAALR